MSTTNKAGGVSTTNEAGGVSATNQQAEQQRAQRDYEKSTLVPVISSIQKKQRANKEDESMGNNEDDGRSSRPISIVTADPLSGVGLAEGNVSPLTQPGSGSPVSTRTTANVSRSQRRARRDRSRGSVNGKISGKRKDSSPTHSNASAPLLTTNPRKKNTKTTHNTLSDLNNTDTDTEMT